MAGCAPLDADARRPTAAFANGADAERPPRSAGRSRGGSQRLADALASLAAVAGRQDRDRAHGRVARRAPTAPRTLFDLTPRQRCAIAGARLPGRYRRALERYRYGPGVFKVDWALDGPIPWKAPEGAPRRHRAHRRHARRDRRPRGRGRQGDTPERRSSCSRSRPVRPHPRPEGKHTGWAYCHVPYGSTRDMTEAIEAQIERFAPGFRDRDRARSAMGPAEVERHNANYVGGDITGGVQDLRQLFRCRSAARSRTRRRSRVSTCALRRRRRRRRPRDVRLLGGAGGLRRTG